MCDKEGVHYEEFSKSISLSEYSNLKLFLSNLLRNLSREKIQRESVVAKLQELSVSEDISQIITTCLWVRKDEIRAHLVSASCNISHGHLNDFDWKLKVFCLKLCVCTCMINSVHCIAYIPSSNSWL